MLKKFKMLLEFVKKEATENGGIGLMETVKFTNDITKVAKKYGFDCYAKGYPKDKIDYVPTEKSYEIKTVEDICKLSEQQFEFFIDDLRNFCNIRRNLSAVQDMGLIEIKDEKKGFTWLDTGLNEAKIDVNFSTSNKM